MARGRKSGKNRTPVCIFADKQGDLEKSGTITGKMQDKKNGPARFGQGFISYY